jgi:hypothetical protein
MTSTTTAQTIIEQIGRPALMRLGAHNVTRYTDAVTFNVKIAKPGQTRARIMLAKVIHTNADLYDVTVGLVERGSLEWFGLVNIEGADAAAMVDTMRRLAERA